MRDREGRLPFCWELSRQQSRDSRAVFSLSPSQQTAPTERHEHAVGFGLLNDPILGGRGRMPAEVKVLTGGLLTDTYSANRGTRCPPRSAANESHHRNDRKGHGKRPLRHDLPGGIIIKRLPRGQQPRKLVAQLRPLPRDVRVLREQLSHGLVR